MAYRTFSALAATICLTIMLAHADASTERCASGRTGDDQLCEAEVPQASLADSLLQKKFRREAADFSVQQVVCDGVTSVGKCWYLSQVGQSCETACTSRGLLYSFAAPKHDMVPLLLGRSPSAKDAPWLHVECYIPAQDRYHPYNPEAWGVPGTTPLDELWRAGQYSYEACQLACPCGFQYTGEPVTVVPTAPATIAPTLPPIFPTLPATPFPPTLPATLPPTLPPTLPVSPITSSCTGLEAYGRCWYLSDRGVNCVDTCARHDCSYSFTATPEEMVPKLIGHVPMGRDEPWAFLECYIAKEDRYHPANPAAWGNPEFAEAEGLTAAGQYTHEACRLSCPCTGQCRGFVPTPTPLPTAPPLLVVQACRGIIADGACWYLSQIGDNCDNTCAAQGSYYKFTAPSEDMTPKLVGAEPGTKNSPWLFVECYVPNEDRYHPYNKNAWGVPEKTPPGELPEAGAHTYPTCQLACPCEMGFDVTPTLPPTWPPTVPPTWPPIVPPTLPPTLPATLPPPVITYPPTLAPTPAPTPTWPPTWPPTLAPTQTPEGDDDRKWTHVTHHGTDGGYGYVTGSSRTTPGPLPSAGVKAVGRTWFMSGLGESCASTCTRNGLVYSWAEPPKDKPITPSLLGSEPGSKQWPWAFLECYVAAEDRYHTVNTKAWGVPGMTPQADLGKAANWSDGNCQLACPCSSQAPECGWVQPPACSPDFEYQGKMYTGCPIVDHDSPWCMHHHHHSGKEFYQYEWSKCINTCDAVVPNENCGWKSAPSCVDEFDYEGIHYVGCTSVDHDTPWCSNTDPYTGSWAHCMYDCNNPTPEDQKRIDQIKEDVEKDDVLCSWRPAQDCAATFTYKGFDYEGCALFVDHPTPWCSHDRVHNGKWSPCEQFCTKAIAR